MQQAKVKGAIGEIEFKSRCLRTGIKVSKPVVDNYPYDFIIETNRLLKIQVKTTTSKSDIKKYSNCYRFVVSKGCTGRDLYTENDVDFFALYILPVHIFYIIPQNVITSKNVRVFPFRHDHHFSKYKDAWHLLIS